MHSDASDSDNEDTVAEQLRQLRAENARLEAELAIYRKGTRAARIALSIPIGLWLGRDLRSATAALANSTEKWRSGTAPPPVEELVNFAGSIAARLTSLTAFRIAAAILIAIATLWFSVAQVLLLRSQNSIIDAQRYSENADLYFRLSTQHAEVFRAWVQAGEIEGWHLPAVLRKDETHPAMVRTFRDALVKIGEVRSAGALIAASCGLTWLPESLPSASDALKSLDAGKTSDAASEIEQAHSWWKSASSVCEHRMRSLKKQVDALESQLQPPSTVQ